MCVKATAAITELREAVDTLIIVANDKLLEVAGAGIPLERAFSVADDILRQVRTKQDSVLLTFWSFKIGARRGVPACVDEVSKLGDVVLSSGEYIWELRCWRSMGSNVHVLSAEGCTGVQR